MTLNRSDIPFPVAYLLVLAFQVPVWLCAGLLWGGLMIVLAGFHPVNALVSGLGWGFLMWVTIGNLLAVGLAWRRSAALPARDWEVVQAALERVCSKLRLIVLAESPDEVVLGPKRALIRFPLQEVRIRFEEGGVTLTAPALSFGTVKKALGRALAERK